MSQIRLVDVSKVYQPGLMERQQAAPRATAGAGRDIAFEERVRATSSEQAARGHEPVRALDHVDLTIPDGQTFAVVGPSGCGKSTLLRVVAGLDMGYTGNVYYDDELVNDIAPKDRYVGMVFQNYALYPHFEGHGNLDFFFKMHKAPSAEAEERIRATSEMMGFGFSQLLDRKPGTLSGGQQQRLAIARALVRQPHLFLFDEPLSNLDAKLRTQTRIEIKRLLHRFQITAIYVTHDQDEAIALGDQIAIMREGKVEQVGTYAQLLDSPINAFVAGFLGRQPMNLAEGFVEEGGILTLGKLSVPLPDSIRAASQTGQKLTVGVRPEAAWVGHPGQPGPSGIRFTGQVEYVEPDFGRHTQFVRVATGPLACTVLGEIDRTLRIGELADVVMPTSALYFFDGATGARLC